MRIAERNITSFFKKNQLLFISVALALFSLHLALTDRKEIERGYVLKEFLSITATPLQKVMLGARGSVSGVWSGYMFLAGTKIENDELKKKITDLENENTSLKEELRLSSRLQEMADFKKTLPYETIIAGMAGYNMELWARTVTIDKGKADLIEKDRAVISPLGVVGRIIHVNNHTARVLLNTDLRSNIDVLVERTRVKGVIEGDGANGLVLKYIRQADDVALGDVIITSGISGVFPKGLVVGTVKEIKKGQDNFFSHIAVTPRADVMRIEEVMVLKETGFYAKD